MSWQADFVLVYRSDHAADNKWSQRWREKILEEAGGNKKRQVTAQDLITKIRYCNGQN